MPLTTAHYLKQIAQYREIASDLDEQDAYRLFSALLDVGVPDIEMGALLTALRMKSESLSELLGFHRALTERQYTLEPPRSEIWPLVIPSYSGARDKLNLLPLLALMARHFGIPVLVHGTLEGYGRVASAYIFRELGIMPCTSLSQTQKALDSERLAFVPTAVLAPGLTTLLQLRGRLGVRNSAHVLVKLLDPFHGRSIRLVSASHAEHLMRLREFLRVSNANALLLRATEGEPFADPARRPRLELFREGESRVLFEAESETVKNTLGTVKTINAADTAAWIRQALAGDIPLPLPLVNQLACCLYACGYTDELNQAKAIAAVSSGTLVFAP